MANTVEYDVDGYELVTDALSTLLNAYPALEDGETIAFSTLAEDGGITFYATSGAIIKTQRESVTGKVTQTCYYPFTVAYRTAIDNPTSKMSIQEFLDQLGRWLEMQTVTINDTEYTLTEYPAMTDAEIEEITRQSTAYIAGVNGNGVTDWAISLRAQYRREFYPARLG